MAKNYLTIYAKSFNWAGFFLPKRVYKKCSSLYDFCRTIDNIADQNADLEIKKKELGEFKIRVNSISPGAISTPLLNGLSDDWDERIKGLQPIEELGQPLDIAYAALFLASDESRFVTGHNLCVDGGLTVDRTGLIKGMREAAQEELGDMRISGMSMGSTGIEETLREIED